jgi:hypothetical protein
MAQPEIISWYVLRIPAALVNEAVCLGNKVSVAKLIFDQLKPILHNSSKMEVLTGSEKSGELNISFIPPPTPVSSGSRHL